MLQTLMEYGRGLDSEPGFKTREVRWCIELANDGKFLKVLPLGDGKRGEMQLRCPDMHNMTTGGKSHFLVETAQTAVLLFKSNEHPKKITNSEARHSFFVTMLRKAAHTTPAMIALANTLKDVTRRKAIHAALVQHKAKPTDWLGWRIDGIDPREADTVQLWWREWRQRDMGSKSAKVSPVTSLDEMRVCLLTGKSVQPLPTHPKITGLSGVGGLGMGDVMVGFDKASFGSFGLNQSANAAMSAMAAQQYVDGLNDLIRNHSRVFPNALIMHWFKEQVAPQDDPLEWLNGFASQEPIETVQGGAVRRLHHSTRPGERLSLGANRYYVLTLSGASGRVMVRDWMEGRFDDVVSNVEAWFTDLAIIARDGISNAPNPKFMAVCGALVRDLKDLPAPTITTLWKVAVQRLPIPRLLMALALTRFRIDLIDKHQLPFNHARMGLIKAYFFRLKPGGDHTMTVNLNPDHPAEAYHCGRLLALLANLQRAALGDVGIGIVQRFYAATSQRPGLILGRLASNARNHLGKLEGELAFWYETKIGDVMGQMKDGAPRTLDLEGQGLFALGYYQQLAVLSARDK